MSYVLDIFYVLLCNSSTRFIRPLTSVFDSALYLQQEMICLLKENVQSLGFFQLCSIFIPKNNAIKVNCLSTAGEMEYHRCKNKEKKQGSFSSLVA